MPKVTEKDVIRLLKERIESLQNKIRKTEAALGVLTGSQETGITKKEKKVIKAAETTLKKQRQKQVKAIKAGRPSAQSLDLITPLKHILPAEEEK